VTGALTGTMTASMLAAAGLAASGLAISTLAALGPGQAAAASTAGGRTYIAGTHPAWAVPSRQVAEPDTASSMTARVYLAGRSPSALAKYAEEVSSPASRLFRKFLTPAQVRQRFGPSAAQIAAVTRWLTESGLRVTAVTQHYVTASGTVAAMQTAFAVRLGSFRGPDGAAAIAPEQTVSVPDSVGGAVLTVMGLDTAVMMMRPAIASTDAAGPTLPSAFYRAGPCSDYFGEKHAYGKPAAYGTHVPWGICGYIPAQLRGAYGITHSGETGWGVTVAVIDAYESPTMPGDANEYARDVGDPRFHPGQYRQVLASSYSMQTECGESGWFQEQTLDVEAVHAMAPGATVEFVSAQNCTFQPLLDAITNVVDNHSADLVSGSWSSSEQSLTTAVSNAWNQVFEQGAVEGIGFDFAAGDCGYNSPTTSCATGLSTGYHANFPPSSPWVTGVGGTSLAVGRHGKYLWQTGWGDMTVNQHGKRWVPDPPGKYPANYMFGGGGGTSTFYRQPWYQAGVVPRSLSMRLPSGIRSVKPMRVVPDVAMVADPATGFLFGETVVLRGGHNGFQLSRIGGTSLAAPLFAGVMADAAQRARRHELGFVNPVLYMLDGTRAFHDITDSPLGPGVRIAIARNEFANTATGTGKITTTLYTLGIDGEGSAALRAVTGYSDLTGLGSPAGRFVIYVSRARA
jgi:subtilase family serine protease